MRSQFSPGRFTRCALAALALVTIVSPLQAEVAYCFPFFQLDLPEDEEGEAPCYGPCPQCPRQTLFQWSACASFSGGPDRDAPLVTDRPDFTESSVTVGRGVVQLETGYTYTYDSTAVDSTRTHSFPESLLRVGIFAEWLELRLDWNYVEERVNTFGGPITDTRGSEDMNVGFKVALTPQEGILPEMAVIPQLSVPVGSAAFTANDVLPGLIWIYGWEVTDRLVTAGQSSFNRALDDVTGDAYLEFAQSWTVGLGITDRVGAYTEWFALFPDGADTVSPQHFLNGGFTFLVNNDLQLDVRAGLGLNGAADDYFLGSGFSVRY